MLFLLTFACFKKQKLYSCCKAKAYHAKKLTTEIINKNYFSIRSELKMQISFYLSLCLLLLRLLRRPSSWIGERPKFIPK